MGYYVQTPGTEGSGVLQGFWWEAEEGRANEFVLPLVGRLIEADRIRRDNVLRLLRMCGNYSHTGLGRSQEMDPNRLRYNLMGQAVDTLEAEVTINEPKATVLALGHDWTLRQAAKAQEQLVEGQMRKDKWWSEIAPMCLRDAEKTGTGLAYSYIDVAKADVCTERVLPLEVVVDEADARYGNPRCIYRRRLIDRQVLAAAFPEHEAAIRDPREVQRFTSTEDDDWLLRDAKECDLIEVVQAWCLPTDCEAGDGRYVVCVRGLDLWDEEYEHPRFPFTKLVYKKADTGWWGISLAEELYPDQIELNRTLIKIQDSFGAAAGAWLVPRGAKVRLAHLTDVPGVIVEYNEGAGQPTYYTPQTVAGELYQHADRIIARALQRVGINEMATAGAKPAGLNSGEAIRSYRDQFSMRQNPLAKAYETFCVDQAELLVMLNRELYKKLTEREGEKDEAERKKMPAIPVYVARGRKKVLKELRWDEVDLPENRTVVQAYPTSSLPSHPSGRLSTVTEWLQAGLLTPEQSKRLLDFPVLEAEMALDMVDHDFALWAFETMVEDGKYVVPEPYQRFDLAMELMRRAYLRAKIDGVPPARLQLVRNHMTALKALKKKQEAADAAKAAAQMPEPTPAPMMGPADAALAAPEMAAPTEIPPMEIAA